MSTTGQTSTEENVLKLLGDGVIPEQVAAACGISVSRVSQLLSDEVFAEKVAAARYLALTKHNNRDNALDDIEDQLIQKLKDVLPFMMKPMEIVAALTRINAAKRRGSSAPTSITNKQEVVQLIMPVQIIQQFQKNSNNQVIRAGDQQLITVQSGSMAGLVSRVKRVEHVQETVNPAGSSS